MTKTGHIATITTLEDAITYHKTDSANDSVHFNDKNVGDKQKCEVVREEDEYDLVNNNDIKQHDKQLNENNNREVNGADAGAGAGTVADGQVEPLAEKFHKEEYYEYFGYRFESKLKWLNIFGITLIHMLFVYAIFNRQPFPNSLWTYVWGMYLQIVQFIFSTR